MTTVNLTKGQQITLTKNDGATITAAIMGLGWDPAVAGNDVDLDANCTGVDAQGTPLFTVSFGTLSNSDGSVRHGGDNLTGEGEGDDEKIFVNFAQLVQAYPNVAALYFSVCSYNGQTFNEIQNAYCRVLDASSGQEGPEFCRFTFSDHGSNTGTLMSRLVRTGPAQFTNQALGVPANGRVASDLLGAIVAHLQANPVT